MAEFPSAEVRLGALHGAQRLREWLTRTRGRRRHQRCWAPQLILPNSQVVGIDVSIPIGIAITIASSDDEEVQRALADAYAQNKLRGKDLIKARRLIDKRRACGKRMRTQGPRNRRGAGGEALLREYEKETSRQKLLVRQARACETRLQFVVAGLRKLLAEPAFVKVLQGEKLAQMPKPLAALVDGDGRAD